LDVAAIIAATVYVGIVPSELPLNFAATAVAAATASTIIAGWVFLLCPLLIVHR
jgi:hypothetical protein